MKVLIISIIIFGVLGCRKKHENIFGEVKVSGIITDIVSNQPISNCAVKLINVKLQRDLIGNSPTTTDTAATTITDSEGKFLLSTIANGQYEFEIFADPKNDKYVNSNFSNGQNRTIKTNGNTTLNLKIYRSAFARVILKNVPPIDTPYFINFRAQNNITINNFYRDTILFIKVESRPTLQSNINYNKNNEIINDYRFSISPWDTISINYQY